MNDLTDDFDYDKLPPIIPPDAEHVEELQPSVSDIEEDSTFEGFDLLSMGSAELQCPPRRTIPADVLAILNSRPVKDNEQEAGSHFYKPPSYDETWSLGWLSFDELPNGTQHLLKLSGGAVGWDDCPYKIRLHILQMIYDLPKIY